MIGEMKSGLYRTIKNDRVKFFKVRQDSNDVLVIIQLEHVDGTAVEMKDTRRRLTDKIWSRLQSWQGFLRQVNSPSNNTSSFKSRKKSG